MESKRRSEAAKHDGKSSNAIGATIEAQVLERIRTALDGLRFGTVTIVVQDGVIVQIERTEKVRLR